MENIAKKYRLDRFPNSSSVPFYNFQYAFGPEFYLESLDILSRDIVTIEKFDFDTSKYSVVNDSGEVDGSGNCIYVAYKDVEKWMYIIGSDLEYGILFANCDMEGYISSDFLNDAKNNFIESLRNRLVYERDYYNSAIINAWATAAKLSIIQ